MENENIPQPLDTLMSQLNVSNADLVNASKEQLSFKMVQKGRKGRRLTPNIQDKILRALLTVRPELKLRRRELFHYEPEMEIVEQIQEALNLAVNKKVSYPAFVDLLEKIGITRYSVDVAAGSIIFYATAGEAHTEQTPHAVSTPLGRFGESALRSAISDTQKGLIDHATFLKRIHDAGISNYEANLRSRKIDYKGETQTYRETIPTVAEMEAAIEKKKSAEKSVAVVAAKKADIPKKKKKVKLVKKSNSVKARKAKKSLKRFRIKKLKKRK